MQIKKYIYLDWNVIQYMKHENSDKKGKEFKDLVKKLSNKYIFPYSDCHLRDLAVSNQEIYIQEDLAFLKEISNNYWLGCDKENIVYQQNYIDIKQFFDGTKEDIKEMKNKNIGLDFETNNSYKIELAQLDESNLFKSFIEKNNGILDNSVFADFIAMLYENIDKPIFYKKFREQVYKLKKDFENTPNSIINQRSDYFIKIEHFLNFIVEDNLEDIKNNFNITMVSFLSIDNKRILENLAIGAKIELAYSLLDYNKNFRDKIKNKNKPSNMINDMNHLYFASKAKYYITEDAMTYKKSKFVCEVLQLKVKILNMDDFINKFN